MAIAASIDATGIHIPTFDDVLSHLRDSYRGIYGADVVLDADTQDGQWIAVQAKAIFDTYSFAAAVYNSFSPATAQGAGLSRMVKINGIRRSVATNSTADLLLVGQAGTVITNGVVADSADQRWLLPASVTIPVGGSITATATAADPGAISAPFDDITRIITPTRGWQTATNPAAATLGDPVETDAALRRRQATSVALPSKTVLDGIKGAVAAVPGVSRYTVLENDTGATDANGLPEHSIAVVAEGGDAQAIATAIAVKKTPGGYTHGTTSEDVTTAYGAPMTVRFFRPTVVPITVEISLTALPGYVSTTETLIQQAVADSINSLRIGDDVLLHRLYVPANLSGGGLSATFDVTGITIARDGGTPGTSNLALAFNEATSCPPSSVVLTVT